MLTRGVEAGGAVGANGAPGGGGDGGGELAGRELQEPGWPARTATEAGERVVLYICTSAMATIADPHTVTAGEAGAAKVATGHVAASSAETITELDPSKL